MQDFGFDAYRMGAIVHITDDAILIGHSDPDNKGQGLAITNPTTGVTSNLHPG